MNVKIKQAVESLERGGIICFPTDSVFAISCDATNTSAVNRIFDLKKREKNKALPVLVKDFSMAKQLVIFNEKARLLSDAFWPGLLTIILPLRDKSGLPDVVNQGLRSLAVRVPGNDIALDILKAFNKPLIGTSANISGMESSYNAGMIKKYFGDDVDVVIDGICSDSAKLSTIIDLSEDTYAIIREGAIPKEEIKNVLGK